MMMMMTTMDADDDDADADDMRLHMQSHIRKVNQYP